MRLPARPLASAFPDHPVARALLALSGPLAVTSANLSGAQSPVTASQVIEQLEWPRST